MMSNLSQILLKSYQNLIWLDVKFNPSEQNRAPNSIANLRAEKPKNNAKFASQSIKFNKIRMNLASNLASKGVKFNAKF